MPLSAVAFQSPRPSVLGHSSPVSSLLRIFLSDTPTPLMNTLLSNIPVLSLLYSAPQGASASLSFARSAISSIAFVADPRAFALHARALLSTLIHHSTRPSLPFLRG